METIKDILIRRDDMTPNDADKLILKAKKQLAKHLSEENFDLAENICQEFFNLESDYIYELL